MTRLYSNARECPLEHCLRTVRPGHLLCPIHWRQVPRPLQSDVWSTWRAWTRTHADTDWAAYLDARDAALAVFDRTVDTDA